MKHFIPTITEANRADMRIDYMRSVTEIPTNYIDEQRQLYEDLRLEQCEQM